MVTTVTDDSVIGSALLTASIKSVKLLTKVYASQQKLLVQLNDVKQTQDDNQKLINKLDSLPTREDFNSLADAVLQISDDSKAAFEKLNKLIDSANESTIDAIDQIDSAQSIKIIKKLIESIKVLRNNVSNLSDNMTTLSDNVNSVHQDASDLSTLTIDSNTRVRSMDMRMAALVGLTENSDQDDAKDLQADLQFLQSLPNEGDAKVDHDELDKRQQSRKDVQLEGKKRRAKQQAEMNHDSYNELLQGLDESVSQMPEADEDEIAKTSDLADSENAHE